MAALRISQRLWPAALLPLIFFALGLALLPYPGLQNDEVLFTNYGTAGSTVFAVHGIPLMLLTYLGAAKTWLFWPIVRSFAASYHSIRIPVLIIGALTVVLFVLLVETAHSRRAAWIG